MDRDTTGAPPLERPTEDVQPNLGTQPGETRWRVRSMFAIVVDDDTPGAPAGSKKNAMVHNDNVNVMAPLIADLEEREKRGEVYREIVPTP